MGGGVNAHGASADDSDPGGSEAFGEFLGGGFTVGCCATGADDGEFGLVEAVGIAPGEKCRWWRRAVKEGFREGFLFKRERALLEGAFEFLLVRSGDALALVHGEVGPGAEGGDGVMKSPEVREELSGL